VITVVAHIHATKFVTHISLECLVTAWTNDRICVLRTAPNTPVHREEGITAFASCAVGTAADMIDTIPRAIKHSAVASASTTSTPFDSASEFDVGCRTVGIPARMIRPTTTRRAGIGSSQTKALPNIARPTTTRQLDLDYVVNNNALDVGVQIRLYTAAIFCGPLH
jgi:hypothetical protein